MSDTTTGTRPDPDELASAYLDGELDAAQRAAVEADPALLARVDELAAARAAVAGPVAVAPPDVQAAALAAALDVHDQLWAARPVPVPETQGWWQRFTARRLGPVLAGAALVAVAALGVVAVVDDNGSNGGSTDFAASAPETTAAPAATAAAGAVPAAEATAPAALATEAAPAPDLGSVDDAELQPLLRELPAAPKAVVDQVEATEATEAADASGAAAGTAQAGTGGSAAPPVDTTAAPETTTDAGAATATTAAAPAPAPAPAPATYPPVAARSSGSTCRAPEGTVFYGTLDVDGAPAEVFVGTSRAVALAVDGCTVLAEVPLP